MEQKESKSLDVVNVEDAKKKVNDVVVVGNGDMFQLLCKASSKSQGWMKSAKACEIEGVGCLVQVTTQQGDHVAEALTFVEGVRVASDVNGGRKLVATAVYAAHATATKMAQLCDEAKHILYEAVRESMLEGKDTARIALDTRFAPVIYRAVLDMFGDRWNVQVKQTYADPITGVLTGSLSVEVTLLRS